jgi:hypothetical protein
MGVKNSLIKHLEQDGVIMVDMFENFLPPLKDKVNILLMGQAAQSGNLPALSDHILLHPQNCLVPYRRLNHNINCKMTLYILAQPILGLDKNAAFLHVSML